MIRLFRIIKWIRYIKVQSLHIISVQGNLTCISDGSSLWNCLSCWILEKRSCRSSLWWYCWLDLWGLKCVLLGCISNAHIQDKQIINFIFKNKENFYQIFDSQTLNNFLKSLFVFKTSCVSYYWWVSFLSLFRMVIFLYLYSIPSIDRAVLKSFLLSNSTKANPLGRPSFSLGIAISVIVIPSNSYLTNG